jgi:hypothetical protein
MRRLAGAALHLTACVVASCAVYTDDADKSSSDGAQSTAGRGSGGQAGMAQGGKAPKAVAGSVGDDGSGAGHAGDSPVTGGSAGSGGKASGGLTSAGGPAAGSGGTSGSTPVGGGAAGTGCGAPAVATGAMPLIDDFNHLGRAVPGNEGRSGVWDVWTLSPSADMFPKSASYQTTGAESGDGYTHWTGTDVGGPGDWGPTLTVQLAGGCAYDASVYSGISLRLKGTSTKHATAGPQPLPLKVMVWQPQGVPPKDAQGGTCAAAACYNHYSTFVNVPVDWDVPVMVPFASLVQGVWTGTLPFTWNPKQLVAIQFQVEVSGLLSELATFDLSIDDLAFVP